MSKIHRGAIQGKLRRLPTFVANLSQRSGFPIQRFLRFGVVGISGLAVDMLMLYLFYDVLKLELTLSLLLAGEVAIVNNFIWNDLWTFGDIAKQQRRAHQILKRFLKFNLVCLIGVTLKVMLAKALFQGLQNAYLSNLLAIAIVTFWNFWVNMKLSWRVSQKDKAHAALKNDES
jgi:dolichol-phosphate mannosyltransferase